LIKGQESARSHKSEYPDETETLWVEFTTLFNERRKREKRSPTKMYNASELKRKLRKEEGAGEEGREA